MALCEPSHGVADGTYDGASNCCIGHDSDDRLAPPNWTFDDDLEAPQSGCWIRVHEFCHFPKLSFIKSQWRPDFPRSQTEQLPPGVRRNNGPGAGIRCGLLLRRRCGQRCHWITNSDCLLSVGHDCEFAPLNRIFGWNSSLSKPCSCDMLRALRRCGA